MSHSYLIYFSHAKENYVDGEIKMLEVGNTKRLATTIGDILGVNGMEIVPIKAYPESYDVCIKQAKQELKLNMRPGIRPMEFTIETGDHVYLGFPNWWGTMPMCVWTFLEKNPLDGCHLHPFCTHEGSSFGHSLEDLRRLCPNATLREGLSIEGSKVEESNHVVTQWLERK